MEHSSQIVVDKLVEIDELYNEMKELTEWELGSEFVRFRPVAENTESCFHWKHDKSQSFCWVA